MRDIFGLIVITLVLVGLGLFRVPDENAMVTRGIQAEAEALLSSQPHALAVVVEGTRLSVSGRVNRQADRRAVLAALGDIQGVKEVRDQLQVLPDISPFWIEFVKGTDGFVQGYVPTARDADKLGALLGLDTSALTVAAGAPDDDWGAVALALADAAIVLDTGSVRLQDQHARLQGVALRPATLDQIALRLDALPEGYSVDTEFSAVDDGLPYALQISRDNRMGLRIAGKLPPEFDLTVLDDLGDVQEQSVVLGPVDLGIPEFQDAVLSALAVFRHLPDGSMTVAPGVISLTGGPVPQSLIDRARSLVLPPGWRVEVALVPEDDGAPLAFDAQWDGEKLTASGKVPADFDLEGVTGLIDRSPYPDLAGWGAPVQQALTALRLTDTGQLRVQDHAITLQARVANPDVAQAVQRVAPDDAVLELMLRDDGTPPRLSLYYAVEDRAEMRGKLPNGLTPDHVSETLGVMVQGRPDIAPGGDAGALRQTLAVLRDWLPVFDALQLEFEEGQVTVTAVVTPGAPLDRIQRILDIDLRGQARVALRQGDTPLTGTRRVNLVTGMAQVFRGGWLPELDFLPDPQSCQAAERPDIAFDPGALRLAPRAVLGVNHAAALIRACTRIAGLTARVAAAVDSGQSAPLNDQLARRRADLLRTVLTARGVAPEAIVVQSERSPGPDRIIITFE